MNLAAYGLPLGWRLTRDHDKRVGFSSPADKATRARNKKAGELICYEQEGHLLTIAPTGEGKGISCAIPALLTYPGPIIVVDPKGESYHVAARWRRMLGHRVIRLDPFAVIGRETDALNPLDLLDLNGAGIEDEAQTIAELVTGGQVSLRDPFWDHLAQGLISGLIAYVATSVPPEDRRLSKLRDLFGGGNLPLTLAQLLDRRQVQSPDARQEFAIFLQHPERDTRPALQSTAAQHFRHFGSPAVRRATDCSTFALDDVVAGKSVSIFIIIPPAKLESHRNLLRLWIGTLLLAISTRRSQPPLRTLLVLDEAAALGPLAVLRQAITLLRWVGVAIWSFWQDASQLRSLYPETWPTIVNNCAVVQLFGARNQRMADEFAGLIGGISGEAVMRLEPEQQLLLINGASLICHRLNYLRDAIFQGRFDPNPMYKNAPPVANNTDYKAARSRRPSQGKTAQKVQARDIPETEIHRL